MFAILKGSFPVSALSATATFRNQAFEIFLMTGFVAPAAHIV
jgi:hypothetical protein